MERLVDGAHYFLWFCFKRSIAWLYFHHRFVIFFSRDERILKLTLVLLMYPSLFVSLLLPTYSFCLSGSFNLIFPKLIQNYSTVECVLCRELKFTLVVGIHFVSLWYDRSRLTGRKTSSVYRTSSSSSSFSSSSSSPLLPSFSLFPSFSTSFFMFARFL